MVPSRVHHPQSSRIVPHSSRISQWVLAGLYAVLLVHSLDVAHASRPGQEGIFRALRRFWRRDVSLAEVGLRHHPGTLGDMSNHRRAAVKAGHLGLGLPGALGLTLVGPVGAGPQISPRLGPRRRAGAVRRLWPPRGSWRSAVALRRLAVALRRSAAAPRRLAVALRRLAAAPRRSAPAPALVRGGLARELRAACMRLICSLAVSLAVAVAMSKISSIFFLRDHLLRGAFTP